MDLIFIIELAIVALIVVLQFVTFFRNNSAIKKLGNIFPPFKQLQTRMVSIPNESEKGGDETEVTLVVDSPKFTPIFRGIVKTINMYIARQKGDTNEETLKELAESKVTSHEKAIESNIAMPLYIGLLCTFVGVIIGLIRIATEGVSDQAIQSFIGGVLIGMVGSANGLALTVRTNVMFKEKKKLRDKGQYDFFNFLRTHFLPEGNPHKGDPDKAKDNLEIFHEGFVQYQKHMNLSLSETLRLFGELKTVFANIRSMELGLKGIHQYLQANDNILEKQVSSIEAFGKHAEEVSERMNQQYAKIDQKLAALAAENTKGFNHFNLAINGNHNGNNGHHNGSSMAYAEAIDMDLTQIRQQVKALDERGTNINGHLISKLSETNKTNQKTNNQISLLNNQLAQILENQEGNYLKSKEFRFFIWTGVTAFMAGISGAIIYIINTFL